MKRQNKLKKKNGLLKIFNSVCGLKILFTLITAAVLSALIAGLCIDAIVTLEVILAILFIISLGFVLYVVIISLINLFLFSNAKFKSMVKLQYLPIDEEEIKKLNITTNEQYLEYIKAFLSIKYKHIDIDFFYVSSETTSVKIPRFIVEQIIHTMLEQKLEGSVIKSIVKYESDKTFDEFFKFEFNIGEEIVF